jgi:hypothetical protein
LFIKHYGNETFKDGDIPYWHFYYLSQQIPALEAKDVFVVMEGSAFAQGMSTPQTKKRLNDLQNLATYGVKQS